VARNRYLPLTKGACRPYNSARTLIRPIVKLPIPKRFHVVNPGDACLELAMLQQICT